MECSSEFWFLARPATLKFICHVISVIEVPFHLLGTYCILMKTPEKMRNVKMSMLYFHICTTFLDVSISYLLIPFVMFPAMAGLPLGLLTDLQVSPTLQCYIGVTLLALTGVTNLAVVENRYYRLFTHLHWEKIRHHYMAINYFFAVTFFIYPLFWVPDQEYGRKVILRDFSCASKIPGIKPNSLYVFSLDSIVPVGLIIFMLVLTIAEAVALLTVTIKNLTARYQHLSKSTYRIQKKFMRALLIQFLVTLAILNFPVVLLCHSLINNAPKQAINNCCFITLSFFGLISTITMITFHQPYREWILRKKTSTHIRNVYIE